MQLTDTAPFPSSHTNTLRGISNAASGAAASLSAWVSTALAERARRDVQLARLREAVADYEAEFGEMTAEELAAQRRADREDAVVVRGQRRPKRGTKAKSA